MQILQVTIKRAILAAFPVAEGPGDRQEHRIKRRCFQMNEMIVRFPGGKRVDAEWNGHTIRTDQSPAGGGEGSAPQPFDLFWASIATCAGIYVKGFCDARGIDSRELALSMRLQPHPSERRIGKVEIEIQLPPGFPEKYRGAVMRAADLCAVKQHILQPPDFEIQATYSG
jgi:putative redox protein